LKAEVNAKDGSAKISNCSRYGLETHALRRIKTRNSCNLDTVPEIAGDLEVCMSGRPRILVVEDDFVLGIMMRDALSNAGFDVVGIARNADQANVLASHHLPNLAVLDIRLANGDDGIDAAITLLQRFKLRCIFVTAQSDSGTRTRANAARPLGWLAKPFRPNSMVRAVVGALDAARKESAGQSFDMRTGTPHHDEYVGAKQAIVVGN
jgi:DNA-binding response OmpR family regulator